MARLFLLAALALFVVGCDGGSSSTTPTGFNGGTTGPGVSTGRESTTSTGGFGGDTSGTSGAGLLTGDWAFPLTANVAYWGTAADLSVDLNDGTPACEVDIGATHALHLDVTLSDGGAPSVGSYDVGDGGALGYYLPDGNGGLTLAATAASGSIFLNRVDTSAVGGNFDVFLQPEDGGATSELSGFFTAPNCGP